MFGHLIHNDIGDLKVFLCLRAVIVLRTSLSMVLKVTSVVVYPLRCKAEYRCLQTL